MFTRFLFAGAIAIGLVVGLTAPDGKRPQAAVVTAAPTSSSTQSAAPQPITNLSTVVLDRKSDGHFYVDATVNGQLVRFVVDTGASGVVLTTRDAQNVGLQFSRGEFEVVGRGASGDVSGKFVTLDRVAIGTKEARDVRGVIADEGLDISLLGQSFLSRIASVEIRQDQMTLR